jgi:hypothetical protein
VGSRVGLDAVVKRKIPSPCRDSNPRSSNPQPNAIPLSYPSSCYVNMCKVEAKAYRTRLTGRSRINSVDESQSLGGITVTRHRYTDAY